MTDENTNDNVIEPAEKEIDLDSAIDNENEVDDVTFEQDADTRENNAPDAQAKVAKLKAEIEKLKIEKQQYLDSWQRDKAEFVNARKRDEDSKSEFMKFANVGFVEELLPVIDSFESALKHAENAQGQGLELIYSQFKSTLKKLGVEEFGAPGEAFDPAKHQAIGNVETTDKAQDHTLAEILQKGYSVQGKIVRPAFVKVYQA